MRDLRDIGTIYDDFFGKNKERPSENPFRADEPAPVLNGNDQNSVSGEKVPDPVLGGNEPGLVSGGGELDQVDAGIAGILPALNGIENQSGEDLINQIARIREMVARDFHLTDTFAGQTTIQTKKDESKTAVDSSVVGTGEIQGEKPEAESERPPMEELNELIGLDSIKKDVKELIDLVKTQRMRAEHGLKTVPVSLHLVFSGNPGTGKTTVARILARLYAQIGALSKGQLVEVDRSGLVAGFVGQTALRTQEKIQEAMGGILFIDEAYTLAKEGNDFGQEAIDTILKAMEDNRDDFCVIVAGYTEPMKHFINSNPGLKSRFNKYFEFPDYTFEELWQIFLMQCRKYDYVLDEAAEKSVEELIRRMEEEKEENFANARQVRNLFEKIITRQATRLAGLQSADADMFRTILDVDVY